MDSSIFDQLAQRGWTFVNSWLSAPECQDLRTWAQQQLPLFQPAAIGKIPSTQSQIRSDKTLWLSGHESPLITDLFQRLDLLKHELNLQLSLPMNGFESHLAFYPPGSQYQAHIDQSGGPRDRSERLVSFVIYLQNDWRPPHGGQLVIYGNNPAEIEPITGRLALFRSQDILHAVRPTNVDRWSLTGWFRRDSF